MGYIQDTSSRPELGGAPDGSDAHQMTFYHTPGLVCGLRNTPAMAGGLLGASEEDSLEPGLGVGCCSGAGGGSAVGHSILQPSHVGLRYRRRIDRRCILHRDVPCRQHRRCKRLRQALGDLQCRFARALQIRTTSSPAVPAARCHWALAPRLLRPCSGEQ